MNKNWYNNYINHSFIDISKYLSINDKKNLENLGLFIEKKLYTQREFELFSIKLFGIYENSLKKQNIILKKYNIEVEDYIKLLNIFNNIEKDYKI